ncbi:MAG: glutathione S-transferase N-terminal domain-containing protein [Burkholderiales bacterium]|nr:glutathione S-transferase N-terminal domain-containing protein [Burkholderiales bacterium]
MPHVLYNGPTSPFGRMTRVVGLELGIPVEERQIDVYTAEFLDPLNPLRQIPTLETESGEVLYDSRVICRWFDSISDHRKMIPTEQQWEVERRWALAIGVMEAGLLRRMEVVRPEGEKSATQIAKLEVRIGRALDRLEQEAPALRDAGVRMDAVATAVALEYTDFRFTRDWRSRCPSLDAWLAPFSARPSLVQTRPH